MRKDRFDLFISKVKKSEGCWIWNGAKINGYGVLRLENGKNELAHRFSFKKYKGDIARGLCILHSCDNPSCVNPDHLEMGTHKKNISDAIKRGRFINVGRHSPTDGTRARKVRKNRTHCKRGHELSFPNKIYITKGMYKTPVCRACRNEDQREYIKRRKNNAE